MAKKPENAGPVSPKYRRVLHPRNRWVGPLTVRNRLSVHNPAILPSWQGLHRQAGLARPKIPFSGTVISLDLGQQAATSTTAAEVLVRTTTSRWLSTPKTLASTLAIHRKASASASVTAEGSLHLETPMRHHQVA